MFTYIMENIHALPQRRFYVGRTNNIARRMNEHSKDNYKNYKIIWLIAGNYESKIKKWGATRFVDILRSGILTGGEFL